MRWSTQLEGWSVYLVLFFIWRVGRSIFPPLGWLAGGLIGFTAYFLRDPERPTPSDTKLIVAPADGVIMDIEEVDESEFLNRRLVRVGIFLSVFDVHVNRSPIAGKVIASTPKAGRYLDARNPESSLYNESRTWIIEGKTITVLVRQITGAIARKIVPWAQVGDHLARGERFGLIRFGSRTELFLPLDAEVLVQVGDRVLAGSSGIARLPKH